MTSINRTGDRGSPWWLDPLVLVELFLVGNIAFLAVDILIAHAVNNFANPWEWVPVIYSAAATLLLVLGMAVGGVRPWIPLTEEGLVPVSRKFARSLGLWIGWGSVVVGIAGLLFHLGSDFFEERTLASLVYTAPLTAPLAYTGLGLVLILNRMVESEDPDWGRWIVLLSMGGFAGNFLLSLADHAQNGFFIKSEWAGVVAGAVAVGFLTAVIVVPWNRPLLGLTALVMVLQLLVGAAGFFLHVAGNITRPMAGGGAEPLLSGMRRWITEGAEAPTVIQRFLFGAPAFAPLLFADVAILALLGLWALDRYAARRARATESISAKVGE